MTQPNDRKGISRLTDAVDAYIEHRRDPRSDDSGFLAANSELRDLLEAMLDEGDAAEEADAIETSYLGDYRIIRELGRGGMGVVYEAIQESLQRRVALKVLAAHMTLEPEQIERFRREAAAIAKLDHPSIVRVHGIEHVAGTHFFAMEFVEGRTLTEAIDRYAEEGSFGVLKGASRSTEAAEIVARVAEALAYSHAAGVVHRDVKPQNILIDENGGLRLVDFGLAKDVSSSGRTQTSRGGGTPYYMSPEQIRAPNTVDARTDVFSLGIVLYELLTGTRPFDGTSTEELILDVTSRDIRSVRPPSGSVARDLETICLEALEKDPADRYQSAAEFAADLRRFLAHEPIVARPTATAVRFAKLVRRHRVVTALLVLLVAIATTAALWIAAQARAQHERDHNNAQHAEQAILSLIDVALSTTIPRRPGDEQRAVDRLERAAQVCETLVDRLGDKASLVLRQRFVDHLTYLGAFYAERAAKSRAVQVHAKALALARRNLDEDPSSPTNLAQVAAAFSHWFQALPSFERDFGQLVDFDRIVERLRVIEARVHADERAKWQRDLAATLSWRATMRLAARHDLKDVRRDLEAADARWQELARTTPTVFGSGWLKTRLHLATLLILEGDARAALDLLERTDLELTPLLEADDQNLILRSEKAMLHSVRAKAQTALGQLTEAERDSSRAIEYRTAIARDFPRSCENTRLLAIEAIESAKRASAQRRYDVAAAAARKALDSIALVEDGPETRDVRATATSTLALILMHEANRNGGVMRLSDEKASEIDSLYETALTIQRELARSSDSPQHRYNIASMACNRASWDLARGRLDAALGFAREAYDNGVEARLAKDPLLVGVDQNFRLQAHILISCHLRKGDIDAALEVVRDSVECFEENSAADYVNAAIQVCGVRRAVLARMDAAGADPKGAELSREARALAMAWLEASVASDPRALVRSSENRILGTLSDAPDFGQLLEDAKRRARLEATKK